MRQILLAGALLAALFVFVYVQMPRATELAESNASELALERRADRGAKNVADFHSEDRLAVLRAGLAERLRALRDESSLTSRDDSHGLPQPSENLDEMQNQPEALRDNRHKDDDDDDDDDDDEANDDDDDDDDDDDAGATAKGLPNTRRPKPPPLKDGRVPIDPEGLGGRGGMMPEDMMTADDDEAMAAVRAKALKRRQRLTAAEAGGKADDDDDSEGDDDDGDGDDDDAGGDADMVLGGNAKEDALAGVKDERKLSRNREGREWARYLPTDPRFLPPSGIKFAFVHLPKAGGRTLECTLQWPMRTKGDYVGLEMPRVIQASNMRLTTGHREWEHVMPSAYALSAYQQRVREVVSVIMVRDPVTRVASEFFTGLRRPALHRINQEPETWKSGHILCRGWIRKSLKEGNITLDEFAHWPEPDDLWAHWNRMVNMLTWKREGDVRTDLSNQERYELAVRRLKRMDIIGVQERFEESMALINCKLLEVTGEEMSHYNWCSNLNKYNHNISTATAERLSQLNSLDMRLYEEALRIFDERVRFWKTKDCFQRHFVCPKDMYCGRKFAMDRAMMAKQEDKELHSRNVICTKACRRSDLPPPPPVHNVTAPAR
jgi:hypothetical protein